jgi:hypothetical protein
LCLVASLPSVVLAQPQIRRLDARGLQVLTFGDILAGTPSSVSRTNQEQRGMFVVRGQRDTEVVITITLPSRLRHPGGASLPIQFGTDDGGFQPLPGGRVRGFDPTLPMMGILGTNGRARVYLGGTVYPGLSQPAGFYQATVTVTVAYTDS